VYAKSIDYLTMLYTNNSVQYYQNNATSPFTQWIESQLPWVSGRNAMAAIRLDATFASITTNIGGKQTKPYKPYEECVFATQTRRYYYDVKGSVVIFRWPQFFAGINGPGYHLHWVSAVNHHIDP
jgi:acetolactate decarboxylase